MMTKTKPLTKAQERKKSLEKIRAAREENRRSELTSVERAVEDSVFYNGYHIEKFKKKDRVIVRRVMEKSTKKHKALIYELGEYSDIATAKRHIDKAAKKFGRQIYEYERGGETNGATPKPTPTGKKTSQTAKPLKKKVNLNDVLREKGLWLAGMQFLSGEEKQRYIDGDKKVLKILKDKLKKIAAKAKK